MPYSNKEQLAEGRRLETAGKFDAAAAAYRKLVDKDFHNQEAVGRLLVVFRKQKNLRAELALINEVLAAFRKENAAREEKWMREHAGAAAAGRAIFRKLGGASMAGFGVDPEVTALARRKEMVERKISGKQAAILGPKKKEKPKKKGRGTTDQRESAAQKKADEKKTAAQKKAEQQKAAAAQKKAEERGRKAREAAERKAQIAEKRAQAAAAKKAAIEAAATRKAAEQAQREATNEKRSPSLFVVILQYKATLEEIDTEMKRHVAFLDKHFENGDFLVSGRQVPRTGGVILAKGKDREAVVRIMRADPFVKVGLADAEVMEFKASRISKGLARYFT